MRRTGNRRPALTLFLLSYVAVVFQHIVVWAESKKIDDDDIGHYYLNPDMSIHDAAFVMSHDAATGYLPPNHPQTAYAKNQRGSAYQQLVDGARALDIRPKLFLNGSLGLHHGAYPIRMSLEGLVLDALEFTQQYPTELVLLLHHNLAYVSGLTPSADTAVTALSTLYQRLGVAYVACSDVAGWTVEQVQELASTDSGGYLLAMDQHDAYASSCVKQNWVPSRLVTCYGTTNHTTGNDDTASSSSSSSLLIPCTKPGRSHQWDDLQDYLLASSDPNRAGQSLGPPTNYYQYTWNGIPAFWQVTLSSAAQGMWHASSILDDNSQSRVNEALVRWIYYNNSSNNNNNNNNNNGVTTSGVWMVDQVALNGNALLRVLRTSCDQLSSTSSTTCGQALPLPRLHRKRHFTFWLAMAINVAVCLLLCSVYRQFRREHARDPLLLQRLQDDLQAVQEQTTNCARMDTTTTNDTSMDSHGGVLT